MQCKPLKIPLVRQKLSLWCWAACAEMVLRYYGEKVDKCEVANWLLKRENCCVPNGINRACNRECDEADVCRIYNNWRIHCSSPIDASVPFTTLQDELCANRPVQAGFGQAGAALGHLLLVTGWYISDSEQWVVINDPLAYGTNNRRYSQLLYDDYYGSWCATWTGLRRFES
jgi:hypothetical protein